MVTLDKLGQSKFDDLTKEFEGDLLDFFKIIESEIDNLSFQGKSEAEINKEIDEILNE